MTLRTSCPHFADLTLDDCSISQDIFCMPLLHNLRKLEMLDLGDVVSLDGRALVGWWGPPLFT